jgi:hypothetical protein
MVVAERIHQYVQKLPASLQVEVLDFIEYLLSKLEREADEQGELSWPALSLTLAMRRMEDEGMPAYTTADLKVVFS